MPSERMFCRSDGIFIDWYPTVEEAISRHLEDFS
ncbi:hypothetical protein M686_08130 [Neisseria gonorrhoeae SK16942]|nr:hypothetical protein M683_10165 [Neisseria gonorrhoeae SK14515]KLS05410.1 hypothetical protein M686_08130 [Neisseria gonorrhoeae SK16942]KLS97100.1 hypothetical protein M681_03925 [Neisseria gonorrhoeae SK12684]